MNVLTIAGNLGRDARLNQVSGQNGPISVVNFTVAVRKRQKDQQGNPMTLWVDCALWGTRADALAQYLTKGSKVTVTGEADVDSFQAQDGAVVPKLTLRVNDIDLQGSPQQAQGGQHQGNQPGYQPPMNRQQPAGQANNGHGQQQTGGQMPPPIDDFDDDIPF